MIGARFGNWYLEREIGRGTQGVVYAARAFDDASRRAAVKVLALDRLQDPGFLQRFPAEMLALHRIEHPNIARLHESGVHAGMAWYAAELVEGTDLASRLEHGALPWREVFSIALQAARALRHGHTRKILHRDLKPSHFMITGEGTLKLLDFGTSRIIPPPPASTSPPLGSTAYLAPEAAGGKPLTRRSDFYSLGGVLYSLVTGRPPFVAASVVELLHKICYTLPERAGMVVGDLPSELDDWLRGLLDKNPARRPVSAAAMLDDLDRIRGRLERKGEVLILPRLEDTGTHDLAPPSGIAVAADDRESEESSPRGRSLVRFGVLATFLLMALGVLGYAFLSPGPDAESLIAGARPLMESADPADWDRAWEEYLEPLSRRHPQRYVEEIAVARLRILDHREQRRVLAAGADVDPKSDAERFYLRGLRLAQAGDADSARRTWLALLSAFASLEAEQRWGDLARDGLKELEKQGRRAPSTDRKTLHAAIETAVKAKRAGKPAEAEAAFKAIEELYRGDADAMDVLRKARN